MDLVSYALVLLIIMAAVLCFYGILALRKITETISIMQSDIHKLVEKTLPVLENLDEATEKINILTTDLERKLYQIENFTTSVKDRVASFISFKGDIKPANPIIKLIKNLSSIQKGVMAFLTKLKEN